MTCVDARTVRHYLAAKGDQIEVGWHVPTIRCERCVPCTCTATAEPRGWDLNPGGTVKAEWVLECKAVLHVH